MDRCYFYMIWLGLCCGLGACSDDEVFDETSYERMEQIYAECDEILRSSEGGWHLKYFPSPGRLGGYNLLMKFGDNNEVTMTCDYRMEVQTSSYRFYGGQGAVLSFNTYSPLHMLADPKYSPAGNGYQGDYELVIKKMTRDSIVCEGRKWKRPMVLVRTTPEEWEKMDEIREMESMLAPVMENMPFFRNVRKDGRGIVTFLYEPSARYIGYFYNDAQGKLQSGYTGVLFSEDGFSLYEAIDVLGTKLKDFRYDDDEALFVGGEGITLTMEHRSAVTFEGAWDRFFQNERASLFKVSQDFMTLFEEAQEYAPELVTFQLYWNLSGGKYFSFVFSDPDTKKTRWYHSSIKNVESPGEDGVILEPVLDRTGRYQVLPPAEEYKAEWEYLFNQDNEASAKTKQILDIIYDPEGFTVVPVADGSYYLISRKHSNYWMQYKGF